jgi:glycosyltransferase involved in cell wall biosynthesis
LIVNEHLTCEKPVERTGRTRPSVLAVTSELPWPLNSGGHLRSFHLLRALARRFDLRLVTAVLPEQVPDLEPLRREGIEVVPAMVGPRRPWREAIRALAAAARGEPYVCYRRHDRSPVRTALQRQIEAASPALLYLDHLDSLLFRRLAPQIPCVIDLHNAYSTLVRRAAGEHGPLQRVYLRREAWLLGRIEARAAREATALLTVSTLEQDYFASLGAKKVAVVPNGVDCAAFASLSEKRSGPPILLYVGALSWAPNAQAALFLAREVLPAVRHAYPEVRLQVVGRGPSPELLALRGQEGVEVTGGVPDVVPYFGSAHVLAVPLEAGGGTRLKILEAFAAGLPVVSTPVGCEGIEATDGKHLLIASRDRFAESIIRLLGDEALRTSLASRARALAREQYDWQQIGAAACDVVTAACR